MKIKNESEQTFDADKYETTHPLTSFTKNPGKLNPGKLTLTKSHVLGQGGLGVVYDGTIDIDDKPQNVVIKEAIKGGKRALQREGETGEKMSEAREKTLIALKDISQNEDRDKSKDPLLSDVQGLENVVVPVMLKNGVLVQEKINGLDAWNAVYKDNQDFPYSDSFVDDPQKAIERICGLVLALHTLHATGIVHHDLKLDNIMFEKYTLPIEEILVKTLTQMQAFINYAKALEEEAKNLEGKARELKNEEVQKAKEIAQSLERRAEELEKLKKAKEKEGQKLEVKAKYKFELEYRIRLIDFGLANVKSGGSSNGAPELWLPKSLRELILPQWSSYVDKPSYDIYTLGTMLPSLLFGSYESNYRDRYFFFATSDEIPSPFLIYCIKRCIRKCIRKWWTKLYEDQETYGNSKKSTQLCTNMENLIISTNNLEVLYKEIIELRALRVQLRRIKKEKSTKENTKKLQDLQEQYEKRDNEINKNKQIYWEKFQENLEDLKVNWKEVFKKDFEEDLRNSNNEIGINQLILGYILRQFKEMNKDMKNTVGRFYPEPVLTRLAKITADCLSIDPELRPTAEEVLMELTDLALSDWGLEEDSFDQEKDLEVEAL
ncbi:MAG: hypothetical protein LBB11_00460, partial [Puniceicoccales bacterium]|nr:hypothetical protein [Puniceicoccales bacterium]